MNENLRTPKKPARATALLLIGIALMGAVAAMPTAAALGTPPKQPCYEDYVLALAANYHPCGACRSGEPQYYTYPGAGMTVSVGGQEVYVPMIIWWEKCSNKAGTDLAGQPVEEVPLPTGG